MIRLYTRNELNHASIAFDLQLSEIYSFGRTQRWNPLSGGFLREQVVGDLIRSANRTTRCAIYSCTVNEAMYKRIYSRVQYIEENRKKYRYNLIGILGIALRIKIERRNAYFCSQFVASLFQDNGDPIIEKDAEWVIPEDFRNCSRLKLIYKGDLRDAVRLAGASQGLAASS
ncbi:hypothetical protein [Paenibacillus marinisediminis]